MFRYILSLLTSVLISLGVYPSMANAQSFDAGNSEEVTASLVAEASTITPGQKFLAAVVVNHAPGWHSYWRNPGGFSLPVTLTWTLPEGFTVDSEHTRWPLPHRTMSQGFPSYTNADPSIWVVEITAPATLAPAGKVTLKAKIEGQVCKEECVLFDKDVALDLTTGTTTVGNEAATKTIQAALATAAKPISAWTTSATESAAGITLTLTPSEGANTITEAAFFSYNTDIDSQSDQVATIKDGVVTLNLKRPEDDTITKGKRVAGVVITKKGWLKSTPQLTAMEIDVELNAKVTGAAETGTAKPLSLSLLAIAFLGGLVLNLMPCVFPVLGLKIMNFVNQAGEDHRKVVLHGLMFTLGVLLSFWALAGFIISVKAATGNNELSWGFQLQDPRFVLLMAVVLFIFSLSLSGLFEFGTAATSAGGTLTRRSGLSGSFFSGVLATLVATPCAAPFLAPALGVALAMPALPSLVMFTAIALGLSAPYLLLSAMPKLVNKLPRPGPWMETFKKLMAFPMYATVAWLVWVLGQQTEDDKFLWVLMGFALIGLGIYILGHWGQPWQKPSTKWLARIACLAILGGSLALAWPGEEQVVQWEAWSPERVAELRQQNRPVFIDFTAAWCATCKANKLRYTHDPVVIALFKKKGVVALKADFTNKDAAIAKAIAGYGRRAVPVNVFYAPGSDESDFLPELFGADEIIKRVTPLPDWKNP